MGFVAIAANTAAAEAIAVDFVDDVEGAVRVCEAGCVDSTALAGVGDSVEILKKGVFLSRGQTYARGQAKGVSLAV